MRSWTAPVKESDLFYSKAQCLFPKTLISLKSAIPVIRTRRPSEVGGMTTEDSVGTVVELWEEGEGVKAGLCKRGGWQVGGASPGGRGESGMQGMQVCLDLAVFR